MKMNKSVLLLPALTLLACEPDDWGPDKLARGIDNPSAQLTKGKEVYDNYCVGCHGDKGDGKGPAAKFLNPKPRDFRVGRLKFAAVEAGQAPKDSDYLRVINTGLDGTAMPAFSMLPENDKAALIAYIKSFYKEWKEDPPGGGVTAGQDPFTEDPSEGIEAGKLTYYGLAKCYSCHPAYETRAKIVALNKEAELPPPDLRANVYESESKDSNWGAPIRAPDFLYDRIKTGNDVPGLARVIAAGVGGTAMPTWGSTLEPEQLWGLAYYVNSVAVLRDTHAARALQKKLLSQTSTTAKE